MQGPGQLDQPMADTCTIGSSEPALNVVEAARLECKGSASKLNRDRSSADRSSARSEPVEYRAHVVMQWVRTRWGKVIGKGRLAGVGAAARWMCGVEVPGGPPTTSAVSGLRGSVPMLDCPLPCRL